MKYLSAVIVFITMLMCSSLAYAGNVIHTVEVKNKQCVYVQELYRVDRGETLDAITDVYIKKNTYGKREHKEFKQGIIEVNQWLLIKCLEEGDVLDIRYWRKYKQGENPYSLEVHF